MAQQEPKRYKPRLKKWLSGQLKETNFMIGEILWAIWALDLQELKPEVERVATSSPEDFQGRKAYSQGGDVSPVDQRYHMARKVAAVWNEEDATTRAKLRTAMCLTHRHRVSLDGDPAPSVQMTASLKEAGSSLNDLEIQAVETMISAYAQEISYINSDDAKKEWDAFVAWILAALQAGR
jgi:hypothetical protein